MLISFIQKHSCCFNLFGLGMEWGHELIMGSWTFRGLGMK